MQIEELIRENTLKKRMNDARLNEVQQITLEIKAIDNKNQRTNEENKSLAITVKGLKDERKRLEEECDGLNALLDSNIRKLKDLERLVRNSESINAKLDKTLHQAENDHQKLIAELKFKNEEAKKAENKLRGISNQINESKITYNNILAQSEKNKAESGANAANLSNEIARGKELQAKIGGVEANIRTEENQLDIIMAEEEKLRKEHFLGLDDNKKLNGELDRLLVLINEY
jgi:chromosome segregation ATPase